MHMLFVDLEKAFNRVPRKVMWDVLKKKDVAWAYVRVTKDIYEGVTTKIKTRAGVSESFEVKIGVHRVDTKSVLVQFSVR